MTIATDLVETWPNPLQGLWAHIRSGYGGSTYRNSLQRIWSKSGFESRPVACLVQISQSETDDILVMEFRGLTLISNPLAWAMRLQTPNWCERISSSKYEDNYHYTCVGLQIHMIPAQLDLPLPLAHLILITCYKQKSDDWICHSLSLIWWGYVLQAEL